VTVWDVSESAAAADDDNANKKVYLHYVTLQHVYNTAEQLEIVKCK